MADETLDYLKLSDEEIMNMPAPVPAAPVEVQEEVPAVTPPEAVVAAGSEAGDDGKPKEGSDPNGAAAGGDGGEAAADAVVAGKPAEGVVDTAAVTPPAKGDEVTPPADKPDADGKPAKEIQQAKDPAAVVTPPVTVPQKALSEYTAEDKSQAFDKLMAPFKANGKMIELRTPEEATKLMQMGAHFTKNMQKLQPQLRVVKMLENNNLLDENKLAFAIDLMQGKPLAIQKLLADSQFDPMAADKDQAATYKPGNHQVTNEEMAFQTVLDDVIDTPHGQELISEVSKQWDQTSQEWLFQHPQVLRDLNLQREAGLYEQITNEMARLQALGQIPPNTPFLQQYNAVGEMLHTQGKLKAKGQQDQEQQQPVEVRVKEPVAPVSNNEKARAAAPTKAAPAVSGEKPKSDVLGLSDEAFLAQMKDRL